jgi:hypothetical protein
MDEVGETLPHLSMKFYWYFAHFCMYYKLECISELLITVKIILKVEKIH